MPEPSEQKIPASEAEAKIAFISCLASRKDLLDQIKHLGDSRRDPRIVPGVTIDMSTLVKTGDRRLKTNSEDDRANVGLNVKMRKLQVQAHEWHLAAWTAWLGVRYTGKSLEAYLTIRRLALQGDTETGLTPKEFTKRPYWLKRLLNIDWFFNRATDAIGFLSYLQINEEFPLGECAVQLRQIHPAGSKKCLDETHFVSSQAWQNWNLALPQNTCGCAETFAMVRVIGAILLGDNAYAPGNHYLTAELLSNMLRDKNKGKAWATEGHMPPSKEAADPVELLLGLDREDMSRFKLWLWKESTEEKDARCLRVEGKLGTLMPNGTIFDDDDD
ncbi:hypothetical protein LTR95_003359 [Oleoguttula sp. CCFEE 5521]